MFYKIITSARDRWYASTACTVNNLITYIEATGYMRDAQVDAIKTYLYLKIACGNKPLYKLFINGVFNTLRLDGLEISQATREYLHAHPAAAALYEYACQKNSAGEQVSAKLEQQIRQHPGSIQYNDFFQSVFYGVNYTDYLFSLPMGAGKTYLMAAFIYLDLYFAGMEPNNTAFAHNFIIFAPSGLKSSVVPSLKTIQKFNPAWILPEPAASELKRKIIFEVLDQAKSSNKSNKTKNPNVQKIANHQPLSELFGLVAVTNAEKVILDRIQERNGQITLFEESPDEKDRQANELRNLIGKLPSLSIFIDEVHHAVSDEIKLRAVINNWMINRTINAVIGFSGTPYLERAEKIAVTEGLSVATAEITNVVYYYPLINGVGNFLKSPVVKISDVAESAEIISAGVREFLNLYQHKVYENGLTAKLGIYCGTIEKCEELVYPLVAGILAEYSLSTSVVLKFHKGNKQYPQPADSQMQFDTLDTPLSNIKIILLVQIGKEGWDCRSLTGIILSQEGDCHTNMVLQTSCRCLRQVVKDSTESALIYLNSSNAEKLNNQLLQQQRISLREFSSPGSKQPPLKRYDRTAYLHLPKMDFYQLKIRYQTITVAEETNTADAIETATDGAGIESIIRTTDLSMQTLTTEVISQETGNTPATFTAWLYEIMKGSFGFLSMHQLLTQSSLLAKVFEQITYTRGGQRFFSSRFRHDLIASNIRKAFYEKRDFTASEELIPEEASLLNISNFTATVSAKEPEEYYPSQSIVKNIILEDKGKLRIDKKTAQAIRLLEEMGNTELAEKLRTQNSSHPQKNRSFHYLPYHTDSRFEQTFLKELLSLQEIMDLGLEVYYNGERAMTEFKIKCYRKSNSKWQYIGMYTPDFLIIRRKDNKIHKAIIVETKGRIYANDPVFLDKRRFMEAEFSRQNNTKFGYERFTYLYLEDTLPERERIILTHRKICEFFGGISV